MPASIDNVSVHGLLINLFDSATTVEKDTTAIVKVKPHSEGVPETMPVKVVRRFAAKDWCPSAAPSHRSVPSITA